MKQDILIIGGGMVGATLACALAALPYQIGIIDASINPPEDARLIALNAGSVQLLKNLGIWPALTSYASPIQKVHVSHRGHFGTAELNAAEFKLNELGFVVPAKYINSCLESHLKTYPNITLLRPANLVDVQQDEQWVTATLQHENVHTIQSRILIAADGTHSTVRKLLNIPTETIDYQQKALVTVSELGRPHQQIAYERFQGKGAIAMLPLLGNQAATIWTDENHIIDQLMSEPDEIFVKQLQSQFGYRLGRIQSIHRRFVYPLKLIKATKVLLNRTLLIGNAAHTIHPIAAQGLNLAFYEIAQLVKHFGEQNADTIGLPASFAHQKQDAIIGLSHHLSQLFSIDMVGFNLIRKLGLVGFNLLPSVKRKLASRAVGLE